MNRNNTIKIQLLVFLLMPWVAACDDEAPKLSTTAEDRDLEDLAWRYLYEPLDSPADADAIFDRIRRLSPDDQREFRTLVIDLQLEDVEITDEILGEIELNEALHERRIERGIDMLDATDDEVDETVDAAVGDIAFAGLYPRASCSVANFPYKVTEQNYCVNGAIAAYSSDRYDNESPAYPACDYRFKFATATRRTNAAGHNAAALCVLSHNNGALLSSYSSGVQYVLTGYNWMTWCNIVNPSTVASGLRIF